MTQKNEKTPVESKVAAETTSVKLGTDPAIQQTEQSQQSEQTAKSTRTGRGSTSISDLSPELIELVTELRDTVKRIDPRKHTEKTLRRVLLNVNDIMKDIEVLYTKS